MLISEADRPPIGLGKTGGVQFYGRNVLGQEERKRVQLARSDAIQVFGAGAGFRGASV